MIGLIRAAGGEVEVVLREKNKISLLVKIKTTLGFIYALPHTKGEQKIYGRIAAY